MDYKKAEQHGNDTIIYGLKNFNLAQILDCGQCFRWEGTGCEYTGIAHGRRLILHMDGDTLTLKDVPIDAFHSVWAGYFGLDRDYSEILNHYASDPSLAKATAYSPGLRVMRQDPWETLITFILSQNSNIPRIKKMVAQLCISFGEELPGGGHAFPVPQALACLEPEALAPIKPGYRAPYIIDAARQVAEGRICFASLQAQPTGEVYKALLQIHGVGPKVAECVLLFGLGRVEICPMDVWMKRVMTNLYPAGFPEGLQPTAGIAQQYLFHYARSNPEGLLTIIPKRRPGQ